MIIRLNLKGSDFKDLVRGKIVRKATKAGTVEIGLDDIGFQNMRDMIEEAIDEQFPLKEFRGSLDESIVPRPTPEADDATGVPKEWRTKHHD